MLRALLALILTVGCSSSPAKISSSPHFMWPVKRARLTQKYKPKKSRPHQGLDLAAKRNTPIFATAPGKVIYTGRDFSGFGKLIIIEHAGPRWASLYAHLNAFTVYEGQWVNSGQKIGLMGQTGNARGNHLHFEIRHNRRPVNPLNYLPRK